MLILLSLWLGLLASAKGLLAKDCDSRPQDLLLLEDTSRVKSDHRVVLDGFIKPYHSPQEFTIQVRSRRDTYGSGRGWTARHVHFAPRCR